MPGVHHQTYICAKDGFYVGTKEQKYFIPVYVNAYKKFSRAEVNAGDTIIPGIPGKKIRLVDLVLATEGGAPGTEDIEIVGKQSGSDVNLAVFGHANLGDNDYATLFDGDTTLLNAGASITQNDEGEPIKIASDGVTDVDHIHISATFVVED